MNVVSLRVNVVSLRGGDMIRPRHQSDSSTTGK